MDVAGGGGGPGDCECGLTATHSQRYTRGAICFGWVAVTYMERGVTTTSAALRGITCCGRRSVRQVQSPLKPSKRGS